VEPSKSPRKHGQTQLHAQLLHMWRYVWSAHPSVLISPLILARDPDNDDRLFQTRPVSRSTCSNPIKKRSEMRSAAPFERQGSQWCPAIQSIRA